jgi:eukaryotic-like serine/threonine-protein kinase
MRPGDVVADRFEIERRAGAGGMGAVYRALDRETGKPVALKIVNIPIQQLIERFSREAQVLADIDHPGVVRYVAHGARPGGEPYLAMEWLEGETLGERLGRAGLTVGETLALAKRLADALGALHGRGFIHRDLKPGNVFLVAGSIEDAKLFDFGIARRSDGVADLTQTGVMIGTPGYMAPEQARGPRGT